ncbi:hypothetical protein HMPREF9244_00636 [Alloscardovia omnicolens F0580]|uniref:Uncharacterized protein n=1 Tax=Alloscardovia omnicolens F0580 TaxID=1321816 RepID=U1RC77_9BIFI|nr:hypothetical protein HMPREF9244_00636 [Alloscardovia omnicolens F0580]
MRYWQLRGEPYSIPHFMPYCILGRKNGAKSAVRYTPSQRLMRHSP